MPAPHSKGKRSNKSKKGKALQRQRTRNIQPADTTAAEQPNATAQATTKPAATASPKKASSFKAPARQYSLPEYPYVSGELMRIGITAAVLIVILIILSIVL